MFCQVETGVAAFGLLIFLRNRLGSRKFYLCYDHKATSSTMFSASETIGLSSHHHKTDLPSPPEADSHAFAVFKSDITG